MDCRGRGSERVGGRGSYKRGAAREDDTRGGESCRRGRSVTWAYAVSCSGLICPLQGAGFRHRVSRSLCNQGLFLSMQPSSKLVDCSKALGRLFAGSRPALMGSIVTLRAVWRLRVADCISGRPIAPNDKAGKRVEPTPPPPRGIAERCGEEARATRGSSP